MVDVDEKREITAEEKLVNEIEKLKQENELMKNELKEQEMQLKGLNNLVAEQGVEILNYINQNEILTKVIRAIQGITEIV